MENFNLSTGFFLELIPNVMGCENTEFDYIDFVYGIESVSLSFSDIWNHLNRLPIHLRYATTIRLYQREGGLHWFFANKASVVFVFTGNYCLNKLKNVKYPQ